MLTNGTCLVFPVVEQGPGHYKIEVAEFGTIHLVPPQVTSAIVAGTEGIQQVLCDVQESGLAVSPILQRASQPAAQPPVIDLANPIRVDLGSVLPEEGGASSGPAAGIVGPGFSRPAFGQPAQPAADMATAAGVPPVVHGAPMPPPAVPPVDHGASVPPVDHGASVPPVVRGAAAVNKDANCIIG